MRDKITIVLADDHPVVRLGLRTLLEKEPDFLVIGEAEDGINTVDTVKRLTPHVLILDLMMPGINGIEVTRRIKKHTPETKVIILSIHSNEAYVVETLRNGAYGYVLKEATGDDLVHAVREVHNGRHYLSPPLSKQSIDIYIQKTQPKAEDSYETLTSREKEVLHLVAEGCSNSEIAKRLMISVRTAEIHRANMMKKLGLRNQGSLIRYALQKKLVSLEDR